MVANTALALMALVFAVLMKRNRSPQLDNYPPLNREL